MQAARRMAVAFKPSPRALRDKFVIVGVGEARPRAQIYLVYPAGVATGPAGDDATARQVAEWFGPRPQYRVALVGDKSIPSPIPVGSEWAAVFEVPPGVSASYIAIEGRHFPMTDELAGNTEPVPHAETAAAGDALSILANDPFLSWRAELAKPITPDLRDPVLAPLAERRTRDAAAAIESLDPETARSVRLRLASVVDMGDGVSLPIWPGDSSVARAFIQDVLEAPEAPRRTLIAQAWLQQQPSAGAVILDDAAAFDPRSGLTFPSILLVNFADVPAAASATRGVVPAVGGAAPIDSGAQPDLLLVQPLSALAATIGADQSIAAPDDATRQRSSLPNPSQRARRTIAEVRIGDWLAERAVIGEIARCRPPGLTIGPLMADWSHATFLKAALDPTTSAPIPEAVLDRPVIGRLMYESGRWVVYLEIGNAADPKAAVPQLFLHFGPRGTSNRGILRVASDGSLSDLREGDPKPAGKATVVRSKDRASYWIPVPASAIEAGRVLRLGVVFIDGRGRRGAWPRPMLPWGTEPGRIAIDLNSWGPG
jgi:hypothetical protein